MTEETYSGIGQTVLRETLPNGLRVAVLPRPGFSKKYAFFATDFGSVDTQFSFGGKRYHMPDGIAHYLEHKMFDTPNGNALQLLAALGASPNAFTSYNLTAYYFETAENFSQCLSLLLHFVSQPYFTQESVEKERGIIGQEIKMYEDSPASRLSENLFRAFYKNHPLRVPIAGTVESIEGITATKLDICHHAFYRPENMFLAVAGDVDPQEIFAAAAEIPAASPAEVVRDMGQAEPEAPARENITDRMAVSQPMFALGFKLPEVPQGPDRLRREMIGDIAAEILCGEASPLYRKLYREGLIDSGFGGGYESLRGMPALTFSGESRDPLAVRQEICAEAERIGREDPDTELFEQIRRSLMGRRIRGVDSFEGMCYRLVSGAFDGYDYFTFPEIYHMISAEDVQEMLASLPERAAFSRILPLA